MVFHGVSLRCFMLLNCCFMLFHAFTVFHCAVSCCFMLFNCCFISVSCCFIAVSCYFVAVSLLFHCCLMLFHCCLMLFHCCFMLFHCFFTVFNRSVSWCCKVFHALFHPVSWPWSRYSENEPLDVVVLDFNHTCASGKQEYQLDDDMNLDCFRRTLICRYCTATWKPLRSAIKCNATSLLNYSSILLHCSIRYNNILICKQYVSL